MDVDAEIAKWKKRKEDGTVSPDEYKVPEFSRAGCPALSCCCAVPTCLLPSSHVVPVFSHAGCPVPTYVLPCSHGCLAALCSRMIPAIFSTALLSHAGCTLLAGAWLPSSHDCFLCSLPSSHMLAALFSCACCALILSCRGGCRWSTIGRKRCFRNEIAQNVPDMAFLRSVALLLVLN
jgi:hypothetical protein